MQFHHVSYSVSNLQKSEDFYALFGFSYFKRWQADDKSLEIFHLSNVDNIIIELFCFAKNSSSKPFTSGLEDDLHQPGIKHIAFKVNDIKQYHDSLINDHPMLKPTSIKKGRLDILYFFIRDPDGNFVEIVQDDRL